MKSNGPFFFLYLDHILLLQVHLYGPVFCLIGIGVADKDTGVVPLVLVKDKLAWYPSLSMVFQHSCTGVWGSYSYRESTCAHFCLKKRKSS